MSVLLIVVVGLIHLIETPHHFRIAPYLGAMFVANFIGTLAAAYGIYRGRGWGWILGALVASGAFAGYVVSRTVGLPGAETLTQENFFAPVGIFSLLVEALYLLVAAGGRLRTAQEYRGV